MTENLLHAYLYKIYEKIQKKNVITEISLKRVIYIALNYKEGLEKNLALSILNEIDNATVINISVENENYLKEALFEFTNTKSRKLKFNKN